MRRRLAHATRTGAAAFLAAFAAIAAIPAARARPAYAARTGLPCGQCHINSKGGGPRTAFGRAFAKNGHRLPDKDGGTNEDGHRRMTGHGMMGPGMMGHAMMGPGMMGGGDR
jgi:hypothetical protein